MSEQLSLPGVSKDVTDQLPPFNFPKDMTGEEQDTVAKISEDVLNSIPLPALATLTADEIFGEDLDEPNENLFLKAFIDETYPIQRDRKSVV